MEDSNRGRGVNTIKNLVDLATLVESGKTEFTGLSDKSIARLLSFSEEARKGNIQIQQKPEKQTKILLYTIEVKEIIRKQLVNNELRLSVKQLKLSSGIYILKLRNNEKEVIRSYLKVQETINVKNNS